MKRGIGNMLKKRFSVSRAQVHQSQYSYTLETVGRGGRRLAGYPFPLDHGETMPNGGKVHCRHFRIAHLRFGHISKLV